MYMTPWLSLEVFRVTCTMASIVLLSGVHSLTHKMPKKGFPAVCFEQQLAKVIPANGPVNVWI